LCVGAYQCLAPAYTPLREFPSVPLVRSFYVHSAHLGQRAGICSACVLVWPLHDIIITNIVYGAWHTRRGVGGEGTLRDIICERIG